MDRLRELEVTVERLTSQVAALTRARPADVLFPRSPLLAITAEEYNEDTGAYSYPSQTADERELPIVYIEPKLTAGALTYDANDQLEYTLRSEYPRAAAYSPLAWFPPGCIVEVAHDGMRARIVHGPEILYARNTTAITAADWGSYGSYADACSQLNLGTGTVELLKYSGKTALVPHKWTDPATPIEMAIYNSGGAITDTNKGLTLIRVDKGRWLVLIDPCDQTPCTEV
jgi:hypothetical protein